MRSSSRNLDRNSKLSTTKPTYGKSSSARGTRLPGKRRTIRQKQRTTKGGAVKGAQNQLKRFKQGSILAIAITGFLLLLLTPGEAGYAQDEEEDVAQENTEQPVSQEQDSLPDSVAIINKVAVEELAQEEDTVGEKIQAEDIGTAAKDEAIGTLQRLWESFYANLPKILVAILTLFLTWLLVRFIRFVLKKIIGRWESSGAIITLVVISVWLFFIGVAISVVAGDIRALVGSLGLIGLALSWSLQTPIESFTGWLLNSFRGYYKIGDRINVGDVFGDVYKIDFLTTTVWEIGGPYRQGFVQAEQATGRLVTFPNNEILSGTVVNLTGDFPFVWDELAIAVANESDLKLAVKVLEETSTALLGSYMLTPSQQYSRILQKAGLSDSVPEKPQVFISIEESWTNLIIRYLVGARERRMWKSKLTLTITEELNKEEYNGKILPVYPRQQIQFVNPEGNSVEASFFQNPGENSLGA